LNPDGSVSSWKLHDLFLNVLPDSFSNLTISDYLWLSNNNLRSLPSNFGNLIVGGNLYLSRNPYLSTFPISFSNITVGGDLHLPEHTRSTFKMCTSSVAGQVFPRDTPESTHTCIHDQCMISMEDRSLKRASLVKPGDRVLSSPNGGTAATVVCTTHQVVDRSISMCRVNGTMCVITPEHPVKVATTGGWIIPSCSNECTIEYMTVNTLCNFMLDDAHHAVVVDGIECISLGHGLSDPAVKHAVWGGTGIRHTLESWSGYPTINFDASICEDTMQMAIQQGFNGLNQPPSESDG